jgi:predicted AlkP superfamily pyrophosphatase or phosphodiesterase
MPPGRLRLANGLRRWGAALAAALVAGAILASAGCGSDARPPGRVLLIGIDGATLRVAGPLMEEGRLPHLARIAREGVFGPLRSVQPLLSPRIWNSIATGKSAEKHGIVNFAREREDGSHELLLSTDRRVPALWNIASNAGLTVAVVNWWNTFPPDRVNGIIVSDHLLVREIEGRQMLSHAAPPPTGTLVFPEAWQSRLAALVAGGAVPVAFDDPFAHAEDLPAWVDPKGLSRRYREDGVLTRFALEIEAEIQPDLMMVLLPGIDRVSHVLWLGFEPPDSYPERLRAPASQRAAAAAAVKRYYEYTDALIGALAARHGERDLVMVVSDHGFEGGQTLGFLTGTHESDDAVDGVIFARGPGIAHGPLRGEVGVYDVTPTLLAWLRLPVARDMDGDVAPFLQAKGVAYTSSYDREPVEHVATGPSGADAALIEQLRALGYLE